jgi:hypothetical protein
VSIFGFLDIQSVVNRRQAFLGRSSEVAARLSAMDRGSLPDGSGSWTLRRFAAQHRDANDAEGEFSKSWSYDGLGARALVSVDYPFSAWHELPHCYVAQGWTIADRRVTRPKGTGTGPGTGPATVETALAGAPGQYGYLLFRLLDPRGEPQEPPSTRGSQGTGPSGTALVQVQVLAETSHVLSEAELAPLRALLDEAARQVRRQLGRDEPIRTPAPSRSTAPASSR